MMVSLDFSLRALVRSKYLQRFLLARTDLHLDRITSMNPISISLTNLQGDITDNSFVKNSMNPNEYCRQGEAITSSTIKLKILSETLLSILTKDEKKAQTPLEFPLLLLSKYTPNAFSMWEALISIRYPCWKNREFQQLMAVVRCYTFWTIEQWIQSQGVNMDLFCIHSMVLKRWQITLGLREILSNSSKVKGLNIKRRFWLRVPSSSLASIKKFRRKLRQFSMLGMALMIDLMSILRRHTRNRWEIIDLTLLLSIGFFLSQVLIIVKQNIITFQKGDYCSDSSINTLATLLRVSITCLSFYCSNAILYLSS